MKTPFAMKYLASLYRGMVGSARGVLTAVASVSPLIGGSSFSGSYSTSRRRFAGWAAGGLVRDFWILGGFAVVPTYAYSGLGGWTFGVGPFRPRWRRCGASWVSYAFADWLGGDRAARTLEEHPKWVAVRHALVGRGFWRTLWIVALIRLPPTSPFSFVSYVMATCLWQPTCSERSPVWLAPWPWSSHSPIWSSSIFSTRRGLDSHRRSWGRSAVYVITRIGQNAVRELRATGPPSQSPGLPDDFTAHT
jgi:hypothetical protein